MVVSMGVLLVVANTPMLTTIEIDLDQMS